MSKFTNRSVAPGQGPIQTTGAVIPTHEGGIGHERDARSELFLLAVTNLVSEDTFYESAATRDRRFADLVHAVTREDPDWVRALVPFLRNTMNMRSASIVAAAEYVKAGGPNGRDVVRSAIVRADEPAEMLAYWRAAYGRAIPMPVKRGVGDAVRRLYSERNAIKYDGTGRTWRFADVIETVHPKPSAGWQSDLFRYLLDKRHHGNELIAYSQPMAELADNPKEWPVTLPTLGADWRLRNLDPDDRREYLRSHSDALKNASWTWERLSGWLPGGMDREAWEAVIPEMGYMALLRNLRNFDQAGVSDEIAATISAKISDSAEVASSRQFPFRLYSAYREIESLRWAPALERALDLSLGNVPALAGKTLVLVDLSGSMQASMSGRSTRMRYELAVLFGFAVAKRAEHATVVVFGSDSVDASALVREPLLRAVDSLGPNMGGTNTFGALTRHYTGHDRVVILTDEQAHDAGHYALPDIPIFTFNLAGYTPAHMEEGRNRWTIGGLTDSAFRIMPLLEAGRDANWDTVFAGSESWRLARGVVHSDRPAEDVIREQRDEW